MIRKLILGEFIKNNLGKYILGIIAVVSSSLLQLTIPKILGVIVDGLTYMSMDRITVYKWAFILLAVSILVFALKFLMRYFIMGRARDLECFLRAKLFAHLQTLPPKFFNNRKTGDLMAYATNDLSAIRRAFSFGLMFLIDGIIINLSSVFVMSDTVDIRLTLISMGPVIAALVLTIKLRQGIRKKFTMVQESYAEISDKVQENISGIRVVKAYVREEHEISKLKHVSQKKMDAQMGYVRLSGLLQPVVQICFGISFTLVLIAGSRYVKNGVISLGDFTAFNTYLTMLIRPIQQVGRIVEVWQKAVASMKRLNDIFEVKTDIVDDNPSYKGDRLKGSISIKNLSFAYPDTKKNVLKDINIDIGAGKTLAIVGRTGSGKSTLVSLLLRLYNVERGHIFIDGMDINDIPLSTLRKNIGFVPQDNFLFSASIKENIKFFKEELYSDQEVEQAAKMSDVYDDIMDFPDGFDTLVGERGVTLSGGQKQRISIARAIIKDPSILILDDSLSAVDTKTEEAILSNVKDILKGRTGIIISHRISTIKHADKIIFMDNGKIVEVGTHEELLKVKGQYYRLYNAQMAENNIKGSEEVAI